MRGNFDKQLEKLHNELIAMGALCETAIASASKALLDGSEQYREKTRAAEQDIDDKEREIESLCMGLLLQQQPVARDLRQVSSALKIITDMERIGDQAADIAEIAEYIEPAMIRQASSLEEMAGATIAMVTGSVDAYVKQDLGMAHMVARQDDQVDVLFGKIRDELISLIAQEPGKGRYALDLLMTAKYLERIGDHAVNITEWVEYSVTGQHKSEQD